MKQSDDKTPRCENCGYNLTGNVSGRCSECGVLVTFVGCVRSGWYRRLAMALGVSGFLFLLIIAAVPGLNSGGRMRAPVSVAKAQVGRNGPIAKGLDNFKIDVGRYPSTAEGLAALFECPPSAKDNWLGPYLDGRAQDMKDSWGQLYQYRCPSLLAGSGYDLWSIGPDGVNHVEQTHDDIGNWRNRQP